MEEGEDQRGSLNEEHQVHVDGTVPREKHAFNGSMLRMTASDSVSQVFSNFNSSVAWNEMKQSCCPFVVVNWAEDGGNY